MTAEGKDERSLGDLLAELSRKTGQLVRKELELATAEMTGKARQVAAAAGVTAAGGALIHAGLLGLTAALVIGLAEMGISPWLSALIVAIVSMAIGYVLVNRGLATLRRTSVAPTQAIETLKETGKWTTRQSA